MSLDKPMQYRRIISSGEILLGTSGALVLTTARCYLTPIQIHVALTIDRLGWIQDTVSAGNVRQGLYRDMGDTPLGGPLVVESASIAKAGTARKMEVTIVPTQLNIGLYWAVLQSDEATSNAVLHATDPCAGGTLVPYYYDRGGGYGAFTNPCPALTGGVNGILQYVRVKSIP
jgi:hypothetical protein